MKVEITDKVKRVIEVELPYYYKHDLSSDDGDSIIYGRIDDKEEVTIDESSYRDGRINYEIEKEDWQGCGSYFTEEHKSTKEEFEQAKLRALEFLNSF